LLSSGAAVVRDVSASEARADASKTLQYRSAFEA